MTYDVFLSYPRVEHDRVLALKTALEDLGLTVWMDREAIRDSAPVTQSISDGLARSRVLLAWYAPAYALSRPCQWELTAAYLAAQHDGGKIGQRLLVVNPVAGTAHVEQAHLKDCQHLSGRDDVAVLAARVRDAVDRTLPPFAHIRAQKPPPWPASPCATGSNRFKGRVRELWEIHNGLIAGDLAIISGKPQGNDLVLVHGMGGIGKSLLAEEYALRFSAAYPGGIFWLSASPPDSSMKPHRHCNNQMRSLAERLGLLPHEENGDSVIGLLRRHLDDRGTYLWVVDDLPPDSDVDLLLSWRAPTSRGRTLVTSRSGRLSGNGKIIPLDRLDKYAALELLTRQRRPDSKQEWAAARGVMHLLGNHALALDVTAATLKYVNYSEMLSNLRAPDKNALELAKDFAGHLPNGHEASVAATLLRSIDRLSAKALTVLRLASLVSTEWIPREFVVNVMQRLEDNRYSSCLTILSFLDEAASEGLLELVADNAIVVHILVSRTIRFHKSADEELIRVAGDVMRELLRDATDTKQRTALEPHAIVLFGQDKTAVSVSIVVNSSTSQMSSSLLAVPHVGSVWSKLDGPAGKRDIDTP